MPPVCISRRLPPCCYECFVANPDDLFGAAASEQMDDRLVAALRVMFSRNKQELEGKTATQLGRYKVCNYKITKQHTRIHSVTKQHELSFLKLWWVYESRG